MNGARQNSEVRVSVNVWWGRVTKILALLALVVLFVPGVYAQTTATITGTVVDNSGALIPGASVILTNEASRDTRGTVSNGSGIFVFPALIPGTYSVKVELKSFKSVEQRGIVVNAGDQLKVPDIVMQVGATTEVVTVQASDQIIPTDSGQRAAVLSNDDIEQLALEGRNVSELLKVLPGVTVAPNGMSNGPSFNFINNGVDQSSVGNGIDANGTPNRGATSQLSDGVDINDPGCNCNNILSVNPDMTQEVSVQTSNFGADVAHGPVIVQSISKSGGAAYHGEGYLYARNDQIDANDWQDNHSGAARGSGYYYYPGGNIGGPVPHTNKKLLFWSGYEHLIQNTGNANVLTSNVPSSDMLAGNFTSTTANNAICPNGFVANAPQLWCNSINGTVLPDGTTVTNGIIPSQFIDPGAQSLSSFWPKANTDPSTDGGFNYRQIIPGTHDGYIYRERVDYNLSDTTKIFVSFQGGYDTQLDQGNGAHIYWTPGNSIPYPGGGLTQFSTSRALAGHFVHIFSPTLTDEFIASWGYGSFPSGPPNADAAFRTTLNYPASYGTVFNNGAKLIPSYSSPGQYSFPDFSQSDIFEPTGLYTVRKELPEFEDNLTKVWGNHTFKFGASTENVDNLQDPFSNLNGSINSFSGQNPMAAGSVGTGGYTGIIGSATNPVANFVMGVVTAYDEWNIAPVQDLAYQQTGFYADDSWKITKRLTVELGLRLDHISHWYDRAGAGVAVYYPNLVVPDWNSGKIDPGMYWHGIDGGIPTSGQPNRLFHTAPRLGIAYDIFGTGRTVVRGGWGRYYFNDQYNDYSGALNTAQAVQVYSLPPNQSVLLSQIHNLTPPPVGTPHQTFGGVTAMQADDYGIPYVNSYNLTISQRTPFNSLLDVAYVGNTGSSLLMGGETISGSGFGDYVNVNKVPLGAFFQPDPVTGLVAIDPQNLGKTCTSGGVCNTDADYHPLYKEYGGNSVQVFGHVGYSTYNALQVDWVKRSSRLTYDLNYTFSKTLNTGLQINPFVLGDNYGPSAQDRTNVFNASAAYDTGSIYHGENKILGGAVNGWTISNITTWQSGGNFMIIDSPNLGMSLNYLTSTLPTSGPDTFPNGSYGSTGIGAPTYFGTSAAIDVMAVTPCNPTSGLASMQRAKLSCFAPQAFPTVGEVATQAGQLPYLRMAPFWQSDLAIYKSFHITEHQSVQLRVSAFNWLNHPLPQFTSSSQLNLSYTIPFNNTSAGYTSNVSTPDWGFLDTKTGAPNQRILEFGLKYLF
jgi:carboxypeptidase family protein